ncbi:MAG: TrmH family RNA methyltransferase [Pseudomonadota bacterium]
MQIALFQPDNPANVGATLRLAACLGVSVTVIEPCGFVWNHRRLRRVGLDYVERAEVVRMPSWTAFEESRKSRSNRLVLLTSQADTRFDLVRYQPDDILLAGRESLGAPPEVHASADLRVGIPLTSGSRSLNVVTAIAIVLGEALRQCNGFPTAKR